MRRTMAVGALAALGLAAGPLVAGTGSARPSAVDDDVHLNEIQVIGSHNSYHQLPTPEEQALRRAVLGEGADGFEYQHQPLPYQFSSQKVRQIELDAFLDPQGGKYAKPVLREAAGLGAYDAALGAPGIKVLHVQDVDYVSTCLSLKACLTQIEAWSDANPAHAPIAVLLELKDSPLEYPGFDFVEPDPWTAAAMETLDAEIRSVMDPDDLITPDDVRGDRATLQEAVTTDGWPTLGDSRGKVMFLMDNGGDKRSAYLQGHPTLEGRVLFTNADPGDPDAGFVERNDPFDASIPDLVRQGYVVRSRADGDTVEARANDTSLRDAALASGAQWVSTDYPRPGMAVGFSSPYYAEIPGGTVARCNPVNAPAGCESAALDTIFAEAPLVDPPPTTVPATDPIPPVDPIAPVDPGPVPDSPVAPGPVPAVPVPGRPDYTG